VAPVRSTPELTGAEAQREPRNRIFTLPATLADDEPNYVVLRDLRGVEHSQPVLPEHIRRHLAAAQNSYIGGGLLSSTRNSWRPGALCHCISS
jgi:hypothetical protein